MKKKKQLYLAIIFTLAIVIGVGYAFLTTNLLITGNTTIKGNTWDVHFENFRTTSGSVTATSAGINPNDSTQVNYTVTLAKPGDFYEFTVDAVNRGTIDAMINSVSNTGLTQEQQKYLSYTVEYGGNYYTSNRTISKYHKLPAVSGNTYYYTPIKIRVEFKKDLQNVDLPSTNQEISLTFSADYVQADGSAITSSSIPQNTTGAIGGADN